MSEAVIAPLLSDEEEEEEFEDKEEEFRLEEKIRKDLISEFCDATPMKMTRASISHNREPMKVFLRVRPFTSNEVEEGESQDCLQQENVTTLLMRAPKNSFAFKSSQRGFGEMSHKFSFSKIFDEDTTQKTFFDETMLGTAKDFIDGQNCLVFTYGVTNAGKTYTIQGVPQDGGILPRSLDVIFNSIENRQFLGLRLKPRYFCDVVKLSEKQMRREEDIKTSVLAAGQAADQTSLANQTTMSVLEGESMTDDSLNSDTSRASYSTNADNSQDTSKLSESKMSTTRDMDTTGLANQVFLDEINARIPDDTVVNVDAQGPIKFSIWVSFAEIYNECIYDLLEPLPKEKKIRRQVLKLAEDKNGSIYIKGLKQIQVNTADEAYRILKTGQRNLSIAATKLNHCSSRSHCIFSVKILRVVDVDDPHVARVSHLSFCDLAGSERYTRTQNTGDRLKEAGNINTSLLTLGKCIHALRYNQNHPKSHPKIIPFRESKLTRLFQSFFLGKGKASMVVNVNQCASGFDETMHVLKFSAIAKQVTTVTSKLDNRWKEPPKKSTARPIRNVSLALNQALDARIKGQRPSVPWATPGTIAQVMKETGHGVNIDDTVFEEEDEDEEVGSSDEEMGVETPVAKKDENSSKVQNELLAVIEVLKQKLVEAKAEQFNLEAQIREEVCQEMAQQLVEIEQDFNDRLEEDKQRAEEVFEKRLEIYAKSVQKPRKRARPDEEESEEQVSVALLAAEQNKVRDRDTQVEKLTADLEATEQSMREFEDKVHDEMEKKEEGFKRQLAEMTEQMNNASKDADSKEELRKQLREMEEKVQAGEKVIEELNCELVSVQETLKKSQELKDTELEKKEEEIKRKMAEITEQVNSASKDAESLNELKKLLGETEGKVKAGEKLIEQLNCELVSVKEAVMKSQNVKEKELFEKEDEFKRKMGEMTEKVNSASKQDESIQELKKLLSEMEEKVKAGEKEREELNCELVSAKESLKEAQELKDTEMDQKEEEFSKKMTEISEKMDNALKDVESMEDLKKLLSETEENLKAEEKEVEALNCELVSVKESLNEAQELKETEMKKMETDFKKKLAEVTDKMNDVSKDAERLEELEQQLSDSTNNLKCRDIQVENLKLEMESTKHSHEKIKLLMQKEVDDLKATVSSQKELISKSKQNLATKEEKFKLLNQQLLKQSKTEQERATHVHDLEEQVDAMKAMEKQVEEAQKEIKERDSQIEDLYSQLEEGKDKIKQMEETMATQLCAELKSHEEEQQELRSSLLTHTQNTEEAKQLIQEQETVIEELRVVIEEQEDEMQKLKKAVTNKDEKIKELVDASSERTTTTTASSSSDNSSSEGALPKKTMSAMLSSASLASTISTTSCEDDDVVVIEPEDQVGYKAGRLSRVEIDATPLQKKGSRKGRATRATKTSTRGSRKRNDTANDDVEEVSTKRRKGSRMTRASSKCSVNEEIENQPEDGTSPSGQSNHGSSQRRGPLSRINEYLQNSPIGKSVVSTAKRLVETATGTVSPAQEPPQDSPPQTREMDTFVPSLVPENKRRKRKLYKMDISAPLECSPYEIGNFGEAKPSEGSGAVITRKLRSRAKKH